MMMSEGGADVGVVRRQSWIGVDYFQALRHNHIDSVEDLRRIPASISNILAVQWSKDGRQIAVSTSDGCIGIYHSYTGSCLQFITATTSSAPATSIRFRPQITSDSLQHVLAATYTNGHIAEYNYQTGAKIRHLVEPDNQLMALDYSRDALMLVTAGKDRHIRVYDETTGSIIRTLSGHTNRIFSAKYHQDQDNIILSGGWDDTVRMWDIRASPGIESSALIYGPHICGDAIDMKGHEILTGSWTDKDQIQIWDIRSISHPITQLHTNTMVYTAQFSTIGPVRIGFGGTKPNEIQVIDRYGPDRTNIIDLGANIFHRQTEGSYSSHFNPTTHEFVSAGAGNIIRVVDLQHGKCREIPAVGFRNVPKW